MTHAPRPDLALSPTATLTDYYEAVVNGVLRTSSDPARLVLLIERLALFSSPEPLSGLAEAVRLSSREVRALLQEAESLLTWRENQTVALFHQSLRTFILNSRLFTEPFHLENLGFGAEEAEKDGLLQATFMSRPGVSEILAQGRTLVIGDRGSGKSAIFRQLVESRDTLADVAVHAIPDPNPLLSRALGDLDVPATVEQCRAAWLLIVAATLADQLPKEAPKQLQRTAENLRLLLGLRDPTATGRSRLLLRAAYFGSPGIDVVRVRARLWS